MIIGMLDLMKEFRNTSYIIFPPQYFFVYLFINESASIFSFTMQQVISDLYEIGDERSPGSFLWLTDISRAVYLQYIPQFVSASLSSRFITVKVSQNKFTITF